MCKILGLEDETQLGKGHEKMKLQHYGGLIQKSSFGYVALQC
jgi:hypothetical protein